MRIKLLGVVMILLGILTVPLLDYDGTCLFVALCFGFAAIFGGKE